ncbi:hypothetical protein H6G27_18765 [Nostoc linckia FACHB-104]|nr:hypothetical protein [Nostoc linckia FACHB-104]
MESNRRRSRISNKTDAAQAFLRGVAKNLPATSNEQQFHALLKHLMKVVGKDSSNNVAIVAISAMFFAFALLVLKPATSPANQPPINLQIHHTTTVTTNQEQNQRVDPVLEPGS